MAITLEEDENGDLVLPLSEELLQRLAWEIGDELEVTAEDPPAFVVKNISAVRTELQAFTENPATMLSRLSDAATPDERLLLTNSQGDVVFIVQPHVGIKQN